MPAMDTLPSPLLFPPLADGSQFAKVRLIDPAHAERATVEAYIAAIYRDRFAARIHRFMPCLLAFYNADGGLRAAAGVRLARGQDLFVEQYLAAAAECCIAERLGRGIDRANLAEVGGFAAEHPGDAREIIVYLTRWLHAAGVRFVLFAATRQLRNALSRLRLQPMLLAEARAEQLNRQDQDWGRYYATEPQVLCGDVAAGLAFLNRQASALQQPSDAAGLVPAMAWTPCP